MGAPVLVGAGIGAVTSLAMGKDPLMGAAMGGLTGGAFGGAEGFGSGFTQGGLFDVGSGALSSGVAETAAPTLGGLELSGAAMPTGAISGGASGVAGGAAPNYMQSYKPMEAGIDFPTSLGATPDSVITQGGQIVGPNMGIVNQADIPTESLLTSTRPYQQGGLSVKTGEAPDTGLLSSAYDAIANMSPLEQTQLGVTAIDAMTPQEQAQQMMQGGGQVTPAKEVTVGTPLAINVPSSTFKRRFA
jgi:hypothetical protein